jgi:hypothetical protein
MMGTSWNPPLPLKKLKEKLNPLKPSQWLHEISIYKIVCHPSLFPLKTTKPPPCHPKKKLH